MERIVSRPETIDPRAAQLEAASVISDTMRVTQLKDLQFIGEAARLGKVKHGRLYDIPPMERYVRETSEPYTPLTGTSRLARIGNRILRTIRHELLDMKLMWVGQNDE